MRNPDFPSLTAADIHAAERMRDDALLLRDDNTPEPRPVEVGITKEDCIKGGVFHHSKACTPDRTERWRSNGACKTWKTRPDEFRLPVKHGLRDYGYIDQTTASEFHRAEDCPHGHH